MAKNMEPVPDKIHRKLSIFASKKGINIKKARDRIIDSALDENGDPDREFLDKLHNKLNIPY